MANYKILNDMPPPKKMRFPLRDLQIGQCLVISDVTKKDANYVRSVIGMLNKRNGCVFTTKTIDGDLHVWRVG